MSLTPTQRAKVIAALKDKTRSAIMCAGCMTSEWTLADGFVLLPLQKKLGHIELGGESLPCVALVCQTCGNTLLFNVFRLGISDVFEEQSQIDNPRTS